MTTWYFAGGNLGDPDNYPGGPAGGLPQPGDIVIGQNAGIDSVVYATAGSLTVATASLLDIEAGASLSAVTAQDDSALGGTVNATNAYGSIFISSGGSFNVSNTLNLDTEVGSYVTVDSGCSLTAQTISGTMSNGEDLFDYGGTVTVTNLGPIYLGVLQGSTVTVNGAFTTARTLVDGAGSTLTVNGTLTVGNYGYFPSLIVENGATETWSDVVISPQVQLLVEGGPGGTGSVHITHSLAINGGTLELANGGAVTLDPDIVVSSGGIIVQAQTAGSPGSPSSASLNGNLTLNAATGHLSVTRSTLTLKGNLTVDNGAGAGIFNGSMTVHGANGISIGVNGSGSVSVEAGAQLIVDNGIALGVNSGSLGTLYVDDVNNLNVPANVTVSGRPVTVGGQGEGDLEVQFGGTFTTPNDLEIATDPNGQLADGIAGQVDVFYSGSLLSAATATLGGAVLAGTNASGEPNGTCGDWSYAGGATGYLQVYDNGEVDLTGGSPTLTLDNPTIAISGVGVGTGGTIRLTVTSTATLSNNQVVSIDGLWALPVTADGRNGLGAANGEWAITVIDGTHIDLQGSSYFTLDPNGHPIAPTYFGGGAVTAPSVLVNSGGFIEVGGSSDSPSGNNLQVDAGGLIVGHGLIMTGALGNLGNIIDSAGTGAGFDAQDGALVVMGNVAGGGNAEIEQNATLELGGSFDGTVTFNGGYETTLKLDQPGAFQGTLAHLAIGDTIDLAAAGLPGIAHTQITGSALVITFSDPTLAPWQYQLDGGYVGDCFTIRDLPNGDTGLTLEPAGHSITTGVPGSGYGNPYVDSLVWGWGKWNINNGPITYWFGTQADVLPQVSTHGETAELTCDSQVDAWTTAEQNDFVRALQDYSNVCGLQFQQATSAATANIVWWLDPTALNAMGGGVSTIDGKSESPARVTDGQLWQYFNDTPWISDPNELSFGGDGNDTIVHEIGHTLGLAHPFDGGSEPDRTTFPGVPPGQSQNTGTNQQNQNIYTVMSYVEGWDQVPPFPPGPDYGTQGALGAFDIAAMQALYGAVAHNAGDDTYTLPTANAPGTGWSSIWDTGGNDTISNQGSNLACTIDLRAAPLTGAHAGGYVSFVHGIQGGFTIANGTTIENAVGGGGDDTLIGGSDPNAAYTFTGGGGNDRIIGGAGNQNTAIFGGPESDYSRSENHDGSWTITDNRPGSPDGTDTLENIQDLKFADGIFILPLTGPSIAIYPIEGNDTLTADDWQGPLVIDGNASVAGQVTVTFNGKNYLGNVDINNGWSVTVPAADLTASALPAGTYAVSAGIQDQIGNSAQTTEQLTVLPPSIEYVSSGQTASGHVISGADEQIVLSGGIAVATTVSGGGLVDVQSGGVASGTVVGSGGLAVVEAGATASGATVDGGGTVTVLDGGTLTGSVINSGTVTYGISGSATFGGTLSGGGTLVVSGGGHLTMTSGYAGSAQVDDASILEFTGAYPGVATFSGASTGPGGTLKFDGGSTGPITVVNSNDTVIAQHGNDSWINAIASYTLPANIDTLFLFAGAQGTGNSDATGDALYALDASHAQTLTGNSGNDAFVVYNSSDVVVPRAGSHDVVYAAASYTLPTGIDVLFLEGTAAQGTGNSDAAGDALYAANPGQVATLTGNSANDVFVVYNSSDVVVPKAGSHDVVYSAVNYTLPTGVDVLLLEAGTQGVGNSDASGDALYAANAGIVQTLTGNSANDTFVVYNSADVVVPKAGSHDTVYSAVNYTLPTGVDTLFLEAGTQAAGNSDASGDTLYAADAGIAQTLTGHSHNDTFVVYNAGDTVIGQASSTDTVYAAANFTLPTNVDTLFLEGTASHGTGNGDAVDALFGNGGVASTLVAGSGADLLIVAGTAGTILTGGAGHDTFAFPNVMGHDQITNFGTAKDTLQFNATLFSNFTAAMSAASQVGANTVFTIDANDTVTLDNVTKTSLTAGNFHFT